MNFTLECPTCKNDIRVNYKDVVENPSSFKCCACGTIPSPDIMTAYQNVGKTMMDLYGCCGCDDKKGWLPQKIEKS